MSVKLLTEHELAFLSLRGDCTAFSKSRLVKNAYCWKSHATAQKYSETCLKTKRVEGLIDRLSVLKTNFEVFFVTA